ncbi:MAG: transposase [Bacteroidales bacterium]|nr:transposase [Bacteroidales bacterium]
MKLEELGIGLPFVKGQNLPVSNCWHFSTDGKFAEVLFRDRDDFIDGMNRIYLIAGRLDIIILAFCLMDNHVHFILYGPLTECQRFMQEFVRQTSSSIRRRYGRARELRLLPVHYQTISDDLYLKNAICYVIKNPTAAGLPYMPYDYPWSSGALYFRQAQPIQEGIIKIGDLSDRARFRLFHTKKKLPDTLRIKGRLILPENYVAVREVEQVFRSYRSFSFFMGTSREDTVESRGGVISHLTLPDAELRQHRAERSREMFGCESTRMLSTTQRLKLARALLHQFNCSPKQVARLVGLRWDQVSGLL